MRAIIYVHVLICMIFCMCMCVFVHTGCGSEQSSRFNQNSRDVLQVQLRLYCTVSR